ncbi:hypothetical protein [Arenibaculum pallidiluteum]|nr:hypothetical protein [Arenibaculum pallidiluteum]
MAQDRNRPETKDKPEPAEDGREKTLTEKEEDETGGANKQVPGPVYDV